MTALRTAAAALLLAAGLGGPAFAQSALVEPDSVKALDTMGKYLAGLETFGLTADTEMEVVLDTDQKLTIGGEVSYLVRRPDRVMIDLDTDVVHRQLYYDGKSATFVSPEDGYYAVADDVPPTVSGMLQYLASKYSIAFPVADLFAWGTEDEPVDLIEEGFHVGRARIGGVETNHWAYRTADQDWEVWIKADGDPLPMQFSYVDKSDIARPRFTSRLTWDVTAAPDDSVFDFKPDDKMSKIRMLATDAALGETTK